MIFKRGKFYWYEFAFRGRRHRATTGVVIGKGVRGEESPEGKGETGGGVEANGIGIRQCGNYEAADIYGHLIPGSNRQAVDRLDDMPVSATATA